MTAAQWTGERIVPGHVDAALWNEHFARYAFAARLAAGKRVLDAGCGTGYGSAELASQALHVTGIDVAAEAVGHAYSNYDGSQNLRFIQASVTSLPFDSAAFDLVVSFEVIEHLQNWPDLIREAARVLSPHGLFVLSTPNRVFYERTRGPQGPNPYHHHEFEYGEFRDALRGHFAHVDIWLEDHTEGVAFRPATEDKASAEARFESSAGTPEESSFFIALCGHVVPPSRPRPLVFVPRASNLLAEKLTHIERLEGEVRTKDSWLAQEQATHQELLSRHKELQTELASSNRWAQQLDADLRERGALVLALQQELEEKQAAAMAENERVTAERERLSAQIAEIAADRDRQTADLVRCVEVLHQTEATLDERTRWASRLDGEVNRLRGKLAAAQESRWIKLGRMAGLGPELRER
ncbi:MAG TPA: methyltransferase domain-containing protein [Bryobacteraceae bacterium]|nr:methyltransferase domain-containing protein [Bryobacteraceae bacterium]